MSSVDDTFERLTAGMRFTSRDPEALEIVSDAMGLGGTLTEKSSRELAIRLGCSRATLHRIKDRVLAGREPEPEPATAFESLERFGARGFYVDEVMLVVYRILGCDQSAFRQALIDLGLPEVSPATICRRMQDLSGRLNDGVRYGHKNRYRFQLTRRFESVAPYDLFQVDEFQLPIDVLVPIERGAKPLDADGKPVERCQPDGPGGRLYQVIQPRLLLLLDAHSRYIASHALLFKKAASMFDTLALFADAFLIREIDGRRVGGAPDTIGTDNGGALVGFLVRALLELVGSNLDIALGYSPQTPGKAKVEANGKSIKQLCTVGMAGRRTTAQTVDGYDLGAVDPTLLVRWDQYSEHVANCVAEWNFERTHTSTGEIPFERLTATGVLGTPVDDEVLATCFLPNDLPRPDRLSKKGRRNVDKEGVRLHNGTYYQSVGFFDHIGKTVEMRTLHHHTDLAAAFTPEGRFIDFAKHPDVWTEEDDRARGALAREATRTIDRIHKSARNYQAAALASDPTDAAGTAVALVFDGAAVDVAKTAKRDVGRPNDVGPARRRAERDAVTANNTPETADLGGALAAMAAAIDEDPDDLA